MVPARHRTRQACLVPRGGLRRYHGGMDRPSEMTEPTDGSGTWVSMREAAERTGVSVSKVRGLYRAGRIRSRKPADWTHKQSTRRPLVMVVLEDVLAQVGSGKPEPETPDPQPSTEGAAPSSPQDVDREEWITGQLEELRRTHDEVAAVRERASRAEKEADGLRKTLGEVQERVERLEGMYATGDSMGPSTQTAIDQEEWTRITAQVHELRRTHDEVAAVRERASRAEKEGDILRKTLDEVQARVEGLERLYGALDEKAPSSGAGDAEDRAASVPVPDVEVEWPVEEPEAEPSRFGFLRRRDQRP